MVCGCSFPYLLTPSIYHPQICHYFAHKNQWSLKGWLVEGSHNRLFFFQAWQLGYLECAHRTFYLQMLPVYFLFTSPKVLGILVFAVWTAVTPSAPVMLFPDVPFRAGAFVKTATLWSSWTFTICPHAARFDTTVCHGAHCKGIIEMDIQIHNECPISPKGTNHALGKTDMSIRKIRTLITQNA